MNERMILAKELFTVLKAAESSLSLLPPNRKTLLLSIIHTSVCMCLKKFQVVKKL